MENINVDALRLNLSRMHREIETAIDNLCNLALTASAQIADLEKKLAESQPPTPEKGE